MTLENGHNPWYVIDGSPLTVEEVERFKESRAWRAMQAGIYNQIQAADAIRDAADVEHGVERHMAGQVRACRWMLAMPDMTIQSLRQQIREDLINARGNADDGE